MEIRLDELVTLLGGELLTGDPATVVRGVASLDEAQLDEASFLGNKKYAEDFRVTQAAVVVVPPEVSDGPEGVALVRVENPTFAFSKVVAVFAEELEVSARGVHPQAIVAEGVEREDQLAFLTERGCDEYQGYLRSRPVPADEFAELLAAEADSPPDAPEPWGL